MLELTAYCIFYITTIKYNSKEAINYQSQTTARHRSFFNLFRYAMEEVQGGVGYGV